MSPPVYISRTSPILSWLGYLPLCKFLSMRLAITSEISAISFMTIARIPSIPGALLLQMFQIILYNK